MEGRVLGAIILILCSISLSLTSAQKFNPQTYLKRTFANKLSLDFYKETCPQAEQIVRDVVVNAYRKDPRIAAGLIRLVFHDCFVQGCDASILLDATPSGEPIERESPANGMNMTGMEVIDEAKSQLEKECPGIVSCADITIFAGRDSAVLSGVPTYRTLGGRRDGRVSRKADVDLPSPKSSIEKLVAAFTKKGMTPDDLVVLSGAHSVGVVHCSMFSYRAMGYNKTTKVDPKLVQEDMVKIRSSCLGQNLTQKALPFDPRTPTVMDNGFYKDLLHGTGLLESDLALSADPRTRRMVKKMADNDRRWLRAFSKAMVRLGEVEVKTGTEGEIRRNCRRVNFARFGGHFSRRSPTASSFWHF